MIPKYISLKEKINQDILQNKYPIGSKLPTEVQLAEEYGVSRSTVRQALDLLVEQGIISKRWGSGNTVLAKSDASKSNTVMIILPDLKLDSVPDFIADVSSVLLKNGLQPEVHESMSHYLEERDFLKALLNDNYAGLIIETAHSLVPSTNIDILQQLLRRQLPIVFINSAPAGLYNPVVVTKDHYQRGYFNARSLINNGYKKLGALFTGDTASSASAFSGFVDAIRDAGLTIYDEHIKFMSKNETLPGVNKHLKSALNTVDAVYADSSSLTGDGTYPVYTSTLETGKSLGKECANALLAQKKNGTSKSVTIPYKN